MIAGEERAHEVFLKNRSRYALLNGLDMKPDQQAPATTWVFSTEMPPEVVMETVDEDGQGELEAGERD